MSQSKEATKIVGICWADPETFWWNATEPPHLCPVHSPDDPDYEEQHGLFKEVSHHEH